jgi:putative peptide zinc metalloprotease protein
MSPSLLTSATSRPLALRWRVDLEVHRQRYQGRDCWVVKDPLRLKYYRFEEEEIWLLRQLDGSITLDDLQRRFERKFPPQQVSPREIHRLIGHAYRGGLLLADGPGQGDVLLERRRDERRRWLWSLPSQLLSLRCRGFDPDSLLTQLARYASWLFSGPAVVACLVLAAIALTSIASHWTEFCLRLPASQEFFGPSNWIPLAVTLAVVKILHEFGHGLACKRFGSECHEMGLLLLCFTPCLYCDVTDAWRIPSKWQRAAIGAAGMYVELWLAALATLVWWQTTPGLVHHLALNVMFVGSVSTLLFNANPLMRYDGYYILADLVEVPNLRARGESLLRRTVSRWLWGAKLAVDPIPPQQRWLLVSYAIASAVYSWCVAAGVLWFFYKLTEPYGFKVVGQLLAVGALIGLVLRPLYGLGRFFYDAWMWERENMLSQRAIIRLSVLGCVVIVLFCVPLPYYVSCAMQLAPADAASVYVDVPGQIAEVLVQPGDRVKAGQPLLRLENLDLALATTRLETQCEAQAAKVTVLRQRSVADESARAEVTQAEQSLSALRAELVQRRTQFEQLLICAPRDGVVLPGPRRLKKELSDQLATWHGHLLEGRNRGAAVTVSDLVCLIGDPTQWEAVFAVDGREVAFVQAGQRVDLLPAQRPGSRITTTVSAVAERKMDTTPAAMSSQARGDLQTTSDARGQLRPLFVTYEAEARFEEPSALLANGGGGTARIHAGYQTPAVRLWRELRRTFHFEL